MIVTATTGPTAPLATGIGGPAFTKSQRFTAFAMADQAGATYGRLVVSWASIAPKTLPASGFDPTDPTSPYYNWSSVDSSVSAATAAGITPILDIVKTPRWAYDVRPKGWTGGRPKIDALGAFATAIATHYDGSGGSAPEVHIFSVWNEPNYTKNLYPNRATYYRGMVNAVADSVHAVNPANLVLAGELAPVRVLKKDRNDAIPPLAFMRSMLCISKTSPVHRTCRWPAKFDVWTHHPYSNNGPFGHAKLSDGVELGDLPKMNHLLQNAQRLGTIASAQPVQFWVTEVGWSSNPPNVHGVPIVLETRWVAESMFQMWKSGVTVGTWFLLQDRPRTFQSGLYFRSPSLADAVAKPLLLPFRFPFVAYLKAAGKVQMWGRDPTSDQQDVTIQMKRGAGHWQTVATVTSNSYGIFKATLPVGADRSCTMRAWAQGVFSAVFSLTVPVNENMDVTPFPRG